MLTLNNANKIELLPEHIIDQIKAGEVLERPASLIKELVENSIDAKSTEINLHIIDNGLELISIEDNGLGMSFSNLPYAFLRHATSKIRKFEDLYKLHSYGFRGEALASIAASARVTCQTQPNDLNIEGGRLIINGGLEELLVPMKNPRQGTAIYIKNLFYNTPVRLKFIKSKTSEKIQLKKMIFSFLLSHPEINFTIKWDEKEKEVYKKIVNNNYLERFEQILFSKSKIKSPILCGTSEYEGHRVRVLLSLEAQKNSPNKHQYFFGNDRLFYDKSLHQTIIRNTENIWRHGESGHYVVFIECPVDEIDVNVHPNKTHIKFSKNDVVYSLLVTAIKDALKTNSNSLQAIKVVNQFEPPSFFSQEDQQRFSLSELKDKVFDSRPIPSSLSQIHTDSSEGQILSNIILLNSNYFIFNFNSIKYLASCKKILLNYVLELIELSLTGEENISPLLISEPFKIKNTIDIHFTQMKKLGFEFDRLNQETIVLRTIPRNIHRELIKISAEIILDFYLENKNTSFNRDNFIKKKSKTIQNLNPLLLYKIYESKLETLKSISIELDQEKLEQFFNE